MKSRADIRKLTSPSVRIVIVTGVGLIFSATSYFSYLFAIAELARRDLPPDWSSDLGKLTFHEIHTKIGPPQDDATAKEYQNWTEYHWWGTKMLTILSSDCCKPSTRPNQISYVVYAKGKYRPVHYETLFYCEHKSSRK